MCETCDPEALHHSGLAPREYRKFRDLSSYPPWLKSQLTVDIPFKSIAACFQCFLLFTHFLGQWSSYDALGILDPEFSQHGRGIFFLPASTTGHNVKNAVLRQKFDASLPYLIKLAVTALTLSFVEMVFLFLLWKSTRITSSPFNTGEWHEYQNDKQNQNKRHNLLKRTRNLQQVMCILILPAAQLCVSSALFAAETVLANNIRADPIIAAYLDEVQREYPKLTTEMIEQSLTRRHFIVLLILVCLLFNITVSLTGSLCMRLNPTKYRLWDSIGGGGESTTLISAEETQAKDEWADTGALARAYQRQLENAEGGVRQNLAS